MPTSRPRPMSSRFTISFNGTSAATPQVSGVAALILSLQPTMSEGQVRTKIDGSADPWGDSFLYGAGKLNAYRAVSGITPPALAVSISGPAFIDLPGTYTWTATPTGGSGSYSYQWQRSYNNGVSWANIGTNSASFSESETSNSTFKLRATVTSGGTSATSAPLSVTVQVSGCSPQGC